MLCEFQETAQRWEKLLARASVRWSGHRWRGGRGNCRSTSIHRAFCSCRQLRIRHTSITLCKPLFYFCFAPSRWQPCNRLLHVGQRFMELFI